jgi:hypothetical protein
MFPTFDLSRLPGAEHARALHIHASLWKMNFNCLSIQAGIVLFDRSEASLATTDDQKEIGYLNQWKLMTLRDGAITIYNFYKEMEAIDNNLRHCPQIKRLIDIKKKREIKRLFESYFPYCVDIRHGVAHLAELYSTPEQLQTHGRGSINAMFDRSYHTSVRGKAISYDLTIDTHKKLETVARRMWAIFTPLIR